MPQHTLECYVSSWRECGQKGGRYVEYQIQCELWDFEGGHLDEWVVCRRFKEFEALHRCLKPLVRTKASLPKKTTRRSFSPSTLKKRQRKLQTYLSIILATKVQNGACLNNTLTHVSSAEIKFLKTRRSVNFSE